MAVSNMVDAALARFPEPRWVSIHKDPSAALWFLKCTTPCRPQGFCMSGPEGRHASHCYLGGAMSEEGARVLAERCGYGVTP